MKTRLSFTAAALSLGLAAAPAARAQQPPVPTEVGGSQLAILNLPAKDRVALTVTTPAFKPGADIPFENTQYRGNVFPGLAWSRGPANTRSYAVIMQDPDALMRGAPILHWTMINIPATARSLDVAMATLPDGAEYGPNMRGAGQAYLGPHTPAGPKHRYHIQVFALDMKLPHDATQNYANLIAAMKDHVLASGEVVGLGQIAP